MQEIILDKKTKEMTPQLKIYKTLLDFGKQMTPELKITRKLFRLYKENETIKDRIIEDYQEVF